MTTATTNNEIRFSGYTLDIGQRKLFGADGNDIKLSSRAFDTLLVLAEHRGETLTKTHLMKAVWPNVIVEENNLNQAISSLRKALGDSKSERRFIKSVPGRGYCFVAQLDEPEIPTETTNDSIEQPDSKPQSSNQNNANSIKKGGLAGLPSYATIFLLCSLIIGTYFYINHYQESSQSSASGPRPSAQDVGHQNIIPNSIAVLPFTNLNSDSEDELFSLGLHDEVINQLSKIRSLNVISRDSIVTISRQQLPISDIGKRLQVESVMTGTILFTEEHARVSLQMLEPRTGVNLWTRTYDTDTRNLSNMISIQSDIGKNVALALEAEIKQQEQLDMETLPTQSFEAYRYNLAAKNAYYQQDFEKTWLLTQQALELDPNYLDALYSFSYVNAVLAGTPLPGISNPEHIQYAIESAEKIIELAPEKSDGYILRASALSIKKEWLKAAEEVERLKAMGVPMAEMRFYALVLLSVGDFDGAIEVLNANLRIEPVNLYGRAFLVSAYELVGNRNRARQEHQIGEELNPIWWGDTINVFLSLGRHAPLEDIDNLSGISDELKHTLKNLDDRDKVLQSVNDYLLRNPKTSAETIYYSAVAAHLNEPELAIELMGHAVEAVGLSFHWLWMPVFDEARQLESFKMLLIDAGIVDYWNQYGWTEVCQPEGSSFTCNWKAYP